jgi:Phosphodiester glycosidase
LRALAVGTRAEVAYALRPASGVAPVFAIGGCPILLGHAPVAGLDTRERAPRSAVGVSPGGRRMYLVTVDGRQAASVGLTVAQFGKLLAEMRLDDAVNLDGGGSSTLVFRAPGGGRGDDRQRPVGPVAAAGAQRHRRLVRLNRQSPGGRRGESTSRSTVRGDTSSSRASAAAVIRPPRRSSRTSESRRSARTGRG